MSDLVIILAVSAGLGAGYGLWQLVSTTRRVRARLLGTPIVEVARAPHEEDVRIVGEVEPGESVLTAPITGRPCVLWHVSVLEQQGRSMRTVLDRTEYVDFAVRDGSGRALVRPMLVTHLLVRDGQDKSTVFSEASPHIQAFLHENGVSTRGLVLNKSMRFFEAVVEIGESVTVLGRARWEHDPDAAVTPGDGYREVHQPKRLILQTPPDEPMLISDEPRMTRRD